MAFAGPLGRSRCYIASPIWDDRRERYYPRVAALEDEPSWRCWSILAKSSLDPNCFATPTRQLRQCCHSSEGLLVARIDAEDIVCPSVGLPDFVPSLSGWLASIAVPDYAPTTGGGHAPTVPISWSSWSVENPRSQGMGVMQTPCNMWHVKSQESRGLRRRTRVLLSPFALVAIQRRWTVCSRWTLLLS